MKSLLLIALIACANIALLGQTTENTSIQQFISSPANGSLFKKTQGVEYKLLDAYTDKQRGINYFYVGQFLNGHEIQNAQMTLYQGKDNQVRYSASRFINLSEFKIISGNSLLSPAEVTNKVASSYGIQALSLRSISLTESNFKIPTLSPNSISPKLVYVVNNDQLILAYKMEIMPTSEDQMIQIFVNAETGKFISKQSLTTACKFEPHFLQRPDNICSETENHTFCMQAPLRSKPSVESASYRVYELPTEAPSFASSQLVVDPSDPEASPYGWHDGDASPSVDVTNLDGTNTYAYNDGNGDYLPDNDVDGGTQLKFDLPYDFVAEPSFSKNAAAVNLFYMINMMHDFSWHFGFTEEAGNFQKINYTSQGAGGDAVTGLSQYSNGTTEKNNADFSTPTDGNSGVMRMFLWDNSSGIFSATAPNETFTNYPVGTAEFGKQINSDAVTGDLVYIEDIRDNTHYFCGSIKNADELNGKIALIDRGGCEFGTKAYNAQKAGAIGVVIVNFDNATINMATGVDGGKVTIPAVMVDKVTGDLIKTKMKITNVQAKFYRPNDNGPDFLDASLDNGIIAHEYGHGISNRLTGGRNNTSCLSNDEQMGEGWSDFFSLVTTRKPNDTGTTPRGVGTYAIAESPNGKGIRTYPYSTDMTINPHTMQDIIGSTGPHYLGQIWVSALWDLYWKMIEEYGDDHLLYGGRGGNSKAVNLVMQGMKLQPCRPGMLDGRDAILAADSLLYDGVNACLIWEVFARRGMGYYAKQNNSNDRNDNVPEYSTYPFCLNKIIIDKSMTTEVDPEGIVTVTINITNFKDETSKNILVSDNVPENTSYVAGSGGVLNGNEVQFNLDSMTRGEQKTFTYQLKVNTGYKSILLATDPIEVNDVERYIPTSEEGNTFFVFNPETTPEGEKTWGVRSESGDYITSLIVENTLHISGTNPSLVLNHRYNTQQSIDGGYVLYSEDKDTYTKLNTQFYRGGKFQKISYQTFPFPDEKAFSGNSNGYIHSFLDLNSFKNKDLQFKFTFGASDGTNINGGGWFINKIDIVDPVFINSEACVTINGSEPQCAEAPEKGTWVRYNNLVKNKNSNLDFESMIYPNPGDGFVNISWNNSFNGELQIEVLSANGTPVLNEKTMVRSGINATAIDLSQLASGMYFIKLQTGKYSNIQKYIKH